MKKAFTITELLVAIGLLAVVMAASSLIFNYSIDAQRTALATAEIMRTLRAITDQINIDLGFKGLQTDGYLVLRSSSDSNDALYFFSTGDFQSWFDPTVRSNIARIYLGPSHKFPQDSNNLAMDMKLLTPGKSGLDYVDVNFASCQADIQYYFEDPNNVLSAGRPDVNMANDSNDARRLLAQNVGSFTIEWTDGSFSFGQINWFGVNNNFGGGFEITGPPYIAVWTPFNQLLWPKALKFTFTLYDSKGIIKHGRRFEHIVYIDK
jgi:prepilin-type N-terminal cleavage/methylation domain-containing protein